MKELVQIIKAPPGHWVGDGFPVRSLFSYHGDTRAISPFLLLDYAAPYNFAPNEAAAPRGVGEHPHRGFETVTIVYDGELTHRDSSGGGGTIRAGDVQWMTAAGGIIHEEFHSAGFSKTGGPFHVVQLWVNLPAKDKMSPPKYQAITSEMIPTVTFEGGSARVIAGSFEGIQGPASTFTPVNLWDVRLKADAEITLDLPEGHNAMIAVLTGHITVAGPDGSYGIEAAEIARYSVEGAGAPIRADGDTKLLVLTGEPIDEPVFGYGPFVMNNEAEIRQAIDDFNSGRFDQMAA